MPTDNLENRGKLNAKGHGGRLGPPCRSRAEPWKGVYILFRWSKMHFLLVLYQIFSLTDIVLL
jgi:hypothetical protein